MAPIILFSILLGWLSYWIIKLPATIKGESPVNTLRDFFSANWKEFILSIIGIVLLCIGGDEIPQDWGKINGPITAFIAGGSIPSMFMNFLALIKGLKKSPPANDIHGAP